MTKARIFQWIGIVLIVAVFGGAYYYFQVRASTIRSSVGTAKLNAPQNDSLTSGLVGLWSFNGDDISGTTAYDRSGSGINGFINSSGVTKVAGKLGQALLFDGGNSASVTLPAAAGPSISPSGTFSAWINTAGDPGHVQTILAEYNAAAYVVYLASGTRNLVYSNNSGSSDSGYAIPVNTWALVTVTINNGAGVFYVNGQQIGTFSRSTQGGNYVAIGWNNNNSTSFNGMIDEMRIYNRALAATEIQSLYALGQSDKTNSSVSQPQGTGRLDSGLAGYWKLDDGSGTSATDSSTNGNVGTLTNGPTWTTGQIGGAVSFDGTNDYINIPDSPALRIGANSFAISLWANPSNSAVNKILMSKRQNSGNYPQYGLSISDGNCHTPSTGKKITFAIIENANSIERCRYTTDDIADGSWHHIVAVADKVTDTLSIYVDGVQRATTASFNNGAWPNPTNTDYLGLGDCNGCGGSYVYGNSMDEVRVYNRTLSADEVSQLYRLTTPTGVDTSLKGYWSFNGQDLSGTTAYDRSGAGNTGTLTNGPTVAEGKIGQALSFDDSDDYVSVADADALDMTDSQNFTLSGWFRRTTATTDDTIIAKRNGIASGDTGYIAYLDDATDKFTFEVSDGTDEYQLESSATFTDTDWHHFTLSWNDSSATSTFLYIDGSYVTTAATGTFANVNSLANAVTLRLGAESDNGNPFAGSLDEIRVYQRALPASEVWTQYLASASTLRTCGTVTDADGNIYGTVKIGTQCWMAQNMRVGTRIAASTSQTNNATTEKYCYSNSDANCTALNPNQPDGGLYQWDEAMQYSTTAGARGICPAGFHIPTDAQQYTLENYLKDSGQTCNASRSGAYDCSSAGTKLKPGGISRFEGNLAGYAYSGSFYNRGPLGLFWSSSESGANAWGRLLDSSVATVGRGAYGKSLGLSVRCLQD